MLFVSVIKNDIKTESPQSEDLLKTSVSVAIANNISQIFSDETLRGCPAIMFPIIPHQWGG